MKKINILLLSMTLIMILTSCTGPGADSGFAPGAEITPVETVSGGNNFKYGETVTTPTGWRASLDTSDSIENKTLSNGWKVEVKYE